jgi:hypothetical protein
MISMVRKLLLMEAWVSVSSINNYSSKKNLRKIEQ